MEYNDSLFRIFRDNCDENRYHISFVGGGPAFDVVISEIGYTIEPEAGHVMIHEDPMEPYALERYYTDDKHQRAQFELDVYGETDVKLIGCHYGASRPESPIDCEVMMFIRGHIFTVKRIWRSTEVMYRIGSFVFRYEFNQI